MKAVVYIQLVEGGEVVGELKRSVEVHPIVAAEVKAMPAMTAGWILSQAKEDIRSASAEFTLVQQKKNDSQPAQKQIKK